MGGLRMKTCLWLVAAFAVLVPSSMQASEEKPISMEAIMEEISLLRTLIAEQQQQIEQLRNALKTAAAPATAPAPVEDPPGAGGVTAVPPQASTAQAEDVSKKLDTLANSLGGFKLSGDFRFRADMQARKGNAVAGPVQNVRSRYRIRLNADKDLDSDFRFHIQLSTGPYNVQTTNDQEFGAMAVKQPFAIAEAFIDYHPSSRLSLRGGRMEEVFADNSRFLWDDDVRFNGFQQTASMALPSRAFNKIEFRAAEPSTTLRVSKLRGLHIGSPIAALRSGDARCHCTWIYKRPATSERTGCVMRLWQPPTLVRSGNSAMYGSCISSRSKIRMRSSRSSPMTTLARA